MTVWQWNNPPGWPNRPREWRPPEGWRPDPTWPPAPEGWSFWVPDETERNYATSSVADKPPGAGSGRGRGAKREASGRFGKSMIGLTAGVVGLIVGVGFGGTDVETIERDAQASADERIDEVEDEAAKEVRLLRGELDEQIDSAVTDAVDEAVAEEKAKRSRLIKKAVTKAVDETTSEMEAQQLVSQPETVEDSTDPQFDTCGAANAAGYGNYREGADPEYDWYQDRDNDGVVCE